MRPKYYIKLMGQMNYKKSFVPFLIVFILLIISSIYFFKRITPLIEVTCKNYAKSIGIKITEETVNELIKDIDYNMLMDIKYNSEGKIIAVSANVVELNKLSSDIAYKIQDKFSNMGKVTVKIPIGELLGLSIFSGYGPDIKIKLVPMGNIETKFESKFASEGINQTKHTIYMDAESVITIVAPFIESTVTCKRTVAVAETVIIGDIPSTYYNIQGLEEMNKTGVLEIMDN